MTSAAASSVRELLQQERFGVLATRSARREGWPFGSIVAYALTDTGEPLLLLSDLAEHTRNLRAEPRASLLVQDAAARDEPLAGGRVTLLGTIEPVATNDALKAAYLVRHPESADYFEMADFRLYRLKMTEARFVNGFGDMGWLSIQPT